MDNDPDVMRYINGGRPTPREQGQDDLSWFIEYYALFPVYGFWAAIENPAATFWAGFSSGRTKLPASTNLSSDTACAVCLG